MSKTKYTLETAMTLEEIAWEICADSGLLDDLIAENRRILGRGTVLPAGTTVFLPEKKTQKRPVQERGVTVWD